LTSSALTIIDSLAHVTHDMKPVENIDSTRSLFGNDRQVGLPHVAANKPQLLSPLLPESGEESPEGLGGTDRADPKQAPFSLVKLVHQGDELIFAFPPANFVGADCGDPGEITIFEPQGDRHFHRADDAVPAGLEDFSNLLPAQPFAPGGQEPGIRHREMALPSRPRQLFDLDATGWALRPPWSVEEENLYAPQGANVKLLTRRMS